MPGALLAARVCRNHRQPRHLREVVAERLIVPIGRNEDDLHVVIARVVEIDQDGRESLARWTPA